MATSDGVREAFEAWARDEKPHWYLARFDTTQAEEWLRGAYREYNVQSAWDAWKSAHRAGKVAGMREVAEVVRDLIYRVIAAKEESNDDDK